MIPQGSLTAQERAQFEALILSFDNHGCSLGLDIQAQAALRRLLAALDDAEGRAAGGAAGGDLGTQTPGATGSTPTNSTPGDKT